MYIPIGPSKKDLYKIIIGLLLIIYLIFLGMYKPKAETLNIEPNNSYCPDGNYAREIHNDKWYYGCHFNLTSGSGYFKSVVSYTQMENGYYDISGYLFTKTYLHSISMSANTTSCFITTQVGNDQNYISEYLSFYCFNVEIKNNNLEFVTEAFTNFTNFGGLSNGLGYGRDFSIMPHFDKSITTNINNIQNNTDDIKNNLNDSSIDSSSANNFTSNSAFQDSNGLDAIIKAPLNFIQSLTSTTCSAISLTIPFINADVSLPCMSSVYTKALGQQLVNLIALVINGIVLYRYCLKILQIVKDAKNPNKDGLEVLDL